VHPYGRSALECQSHLSRWTGRWNVVAHFGWRLSRQFDASSSLSQAARTVVLRRHPSFASRLRRTSEILESAPTWREIRQLVEMRNKVCLPESASPNSGILEEDCTDRLVNLAGVVERYSWASSGREFFV
jgi:hypothetical protein